MQLILYILKCGAVFLGTVAFVYDNLHGHDTDLTAKLFQRLLKSTQGITDQTLFFT